MGKESRASDAVRALGMYNVTVTLVYHDGPFEEIDAKAWVHKGDALALTINDDRLRVIPMTSLKYYEVRNQEIDRKEVLHA